MGMQTDQKTRRKAWVLLVLVIIAMLIPMYSGLKDGGTVKYQAFLYSVTKRHSIGSEEYNGGLRWGYHIGTEVRILFWEVYNDVEFYPDDIETTLSPAAEDSP